MLNLISTTTIFGTPVDVTLQELALETFFPADAAHGEAIARDGRQSLAELAPVRSSTAAAPSGRHQAVIRRRHARFVDRASNARSRLYTEISSTTVLQLSTRYWNDWSTRPNARTIC